MMKPFVFLHRSRIRLLPLLLLATVLPDGWAQGQDQGAERLLRDAGFVDVRVSDDTAWYRRQSREEYERLRGDQFRRRKDLMRFGLFGAGRRDP